LLRDQKAVVREKKKGRKENVSERTKVTESVKTTNRIGHKNIEFFSLKMKGGPYLTNLSVRERRDPS
jgi:hypothetical protein